MSYLAENPLPSSPKKLPKREENPIQNIEQAKSMLSEKSLSPGFRAKAMAYLIGRTGLKSTSETTRVHALSVLKSPHILQSKFMDKLIQTFEKNPANATVVKKANTYLAQI